MSLVSEKKRCQNIKEVDTMQNSRFLIGTILVIIAALMFLFSDYSSSGITALAIIGLISIAISRKK